MGFKRPDLASINARLLATQATDPATSLQEIIAAGPVLRPLAPPTQSKHDNAINYLTIFLQKLNNDCAPEEIQTRFLQRGSEELSVQQWQAYIRFLTQVMPGRMTPDGRATYTSVTSKVFACLSAYRRLTGNKLPAKGRAEVCDFLATLGDLAPKIAREKPVANADDYMNILTTIAMGKAASRSTREKTQLLSFLQLLTITSSRPGELVLSKGYDDALKWKDVVFFATTIGEENVICAEVCIRNLKGKRVDNSKFKKHIVRCAGPPACNPVVALLALALLDNVLPDYAGPDGPRYLQHIEIPPNTGKLYLSKDPNMEDQFAYRILKSGEPETVTPAGWKYQSVKSCFRRAVQAAGMYNCGTLYSFRRAATAYMDGANVGEHNIKHAMGHNKTSKTFADAYLSKTSSVDLQAIMTNLPECDILQLNGFDYAVGLPQSLSNEGRRAVFESPELVELMARQARIRSSLCLYYGSCKAAKVAKAPESNDYEMLGKEIYNVSRRLIRLAFKEEVEEYIQQYRQTLQDQSIELTKAHVEALQMTKENARPALDEALLQVCNEDEGIVEAGWADATQFLQRLPTMEDGDSLEGAVATALDDMEREYEEEEDDEQEDEDD